MNRVDHDDGAWRQAIVEQFESPLIRYAARLLGDVDRARDVAQDTFLQLCRQPRQQIEDGVRPWLFAVCRHRALDVRKKEQRMKTLNGDQVGQSASPEADVQEFHARRELAAQAAQLLDGLPDNQREVILLKVQDDMSYREISAVTGLSESNVGLLLHKGFRTLRERMNRVG